MHSALLVFLGAGLGGTLRHLLNSLAARWLGAGFPFGIPLINIVGCFAMGLIAGLFARGGDPGSSWRLFLTTGVLGGFTTFSAFALDTATLWARGSHGMAALYVGGSVVGSLVAIAAGLMLAHVLA